LAAAVPEQPGDIAEHPLTPAAIEGTA